MDILDFYSGFNMLAGWSVYAILDHHLLNHRRRLSSWHLLGFIGAFQLCSLTVEYSAAYWGGYLIEQIAFYRITKLFIGLLLLELILSIVTSANLFRKFRDNHRLRKVQLGLILLYLIGHIVVLGIRPLDYATSIIPGWHTTIVAVGNKFGALLWFVIFLIMGLVDRFTYPKIEDDVIQ